jgi:hypothetical protein
MMRVCFLKIPLRSLTGTLIPAASEGGEQTKKQQQQQKQ